MKSFWNNLRPLEKRIVFIAAVIVLVLANFWFVVPHFSDWGKVNTKMENALATMRKWQTQIDKRPRLEAEIKRLTGSGLAVVQEEQQTHFSTAINSQAAQSQLTITGTGRQQTKTNQFFLDVSQNINFTSKESQLVDFLYNLGNGPSQIRVRSLRLRPDPPRFLLAGDITLAASYQKKTPTKAPATAPASSPVSKPVPSSAPKQAPVTATNVTSTSSKTNRPALATRPATPTNDLHS